MKLNIFNKTVTIKGILYRVDRWINLVTSNLTRKIKIKETSIKVDVPNFYYCSNLVTYRYNTTKTKERDLFFWLLNLSKSKQSWDSFIDVGCNIGVFSILCKKFFKNIKILALDPLLFNCLTTYKFLENNSQNKSLDIVQQAYLSFDSTIERNIDVLASSGSVVSFEERKKNFQINSKNCITLPFSAFGNFGINSRKSVASICKIDVDGPEFEILGGFSDEQFSLIGALCIEVDILDPDVSIKIDTFLKSKNYYSCNHNILSLDYYIENLNSKYVDKINKLKNLLNESQNWCVDNSLNSDTKKNKFHENRSFSYSELLNNKTSKDLVNYRLGINWFYYSKNMINNLEYVKFK